MNRTNSAPRPRASRLALASFWFAIVGAFVPMAAAIVGAVTYTEGREFDFGRAGTAVILAAYLYPWGGAAAFVALVLGIASLLRDQPQHPLGRAGVTIGAIVSFPGLVLLAATAFASTV